MYHKNIIVKLKKVESHFIALKKKNLNRQHKEAIEMNKRTVKLHILPQFDDDLVIT